LLTNTEDFAGRQRRRRLEEALIAVRYWKATL